MTTIPLRNDIMKSPFSFSNSASLLSSLLLGIASLCVGTANAAEIQHVEPPNWWVGMKQTSLQVMVHSEGIAHLQVQLHYPGVRLRGVERSDNPNFLFLNLDIAPNTKPGQLQFEFKQGKQLVHSLPYRLEARRPQSAQRTS
ncbi:MAG: cyclomaltodextrinase N-terminal domain-containing protein, partial [Burkholderiales bacterium]|nr:cyclomaltodextrinase N-terminal domain-containing protein [Burkholderiales bacterium]